MVLCSVNPAQDGSDAGEVWLYTAAEMTKLVKVNFALSPPWGSCMAVIRR